MSLSFKIVSWNGHLSIEDVSFEKNGIAFSNYPYPPASVYPSGLVEHDSIREILVDQAPPEIRTNHGEVLFVSATLKRKLLKFAKKNRLAVVRRVDVWHFILEPFLDTTQDDSKAMSILEANGVNSAECLELREVLRDVMHAYNITSGLWDWTHLGLSCVLTALLKSESFQVCHQYALPPDEYEAFYHKAMEIAERGSLIA